MVTRDVPSSSADDRTAKDMEVWEQFQKGMHLGRDPGFERAVCSEQFRDVIKRLEKSQVPKCVLGIAYGTRTA